MCSQQCVEPARPPPSSRSLGLGLCGPLADIVLTAPLFVPAAPAVWAQGPTFTGTSPVAPLCPRESGMPFV